MQQQRREHLPQLQVRSAVLDTAMRAAELGICVVPPAEDGSKRPLPGGAGQWKDYQTHPPTLAQIAEWYGPKIGIGFVCGKVSGGLELFEFDDRQTYEDFKEAAIGLGGADLIDRIESGYLEETPGGGIHWFYYAREVRGSTKLATRRADSTVKTLIETKGEGGFVIVSPTSGQVHPSGKPYRLVRGDIGTIAEVSDAEREWLWRLARSFDSGSEVPAAPAEAKVADKYRRGTGEWDDTITPGDDYNQRTAWADILVGWSFCYQHGETQFWRRPGKGEGHSATINHTGTNRLHVFTSSSAFEPNQSYSKFGAYAVLSHRGDYAAAAKALYQAGYGTHKRWVKDGPKWVLRSFSNPIPKGERAAKPGEPPPEILPNGTVAKATAKTQVADVFGDLADEDLGLVVASSLTPQSISWLWPNRIAQGKLNLIAGEGGDGKSQITISLVASITKGDLFPDGTGPAPHGSCCILSAEDGARDTIVPRLIAAGADLSRAFINTAKVTLKDRDGKAQIHPVSFQDLAYWRVVFTRHNVRLLVADPLPAYLGRGVNDHRNNEVRAVLEPFVDLLNECGVAMVAITHLNKSTDQKSPTHKILGSVAYSNLARVVYGTYRDTEDETRRYFAMIKANIVAPQPPLAYKIEPVEFEHQGEVIVTSRVAFDTAECHFSPTAHMAGTSSKPGRPPTTSLKDAEWLHDVLWGSNWVPLASIAEMAGEAGMLGERKPDGKYPSINRLYRAKDRVNELDGDRKGFVVDEDRLPFRGTGKACIHWKLVPEDAPVRPF